MPSFDSLARWARYEPSLGNNLELPPGERFYLRVCAGLTIEEHRALTERLEAGHGDGEAVAKNLKGVIELGDEPLMVRGKRVETLADYLELAAKQRGSDLLAELFAVLHRYNSLEGQAELFSARLSGGAPTTRRAPQAAVAHSGSETKPSPGPTPPEPLAPASVAGSPASTTEAPSPSNPG